MTATQPQPPKPGFRLTASSLKWIFLGILTLIVAGLVFSAWHGLNQNLAQPVPKPETAPPPQVEMLAPIGGNRSASLPTFTPPSKNTTAGTEAATSEASVPKPVAKPKIKPKPAVDTESGITVDTMPGTELKPINVPQETKPVHRPTKTRQDNLDALF